MRPGLLKAFVPRHLFRCCHSWPRVRIGGTVMGALIARIAAYVAELPVVAKIVTAGMAATAAFLAAKGIANFASSPPSNSPASAQFVQGIASGNGAASSAIQARAGSQGPGLTQASGKLREVVRRLGGDPN